MNVLVIDDDRRVRDTIKNELSRSGYQVLEAADGEQGFKVLANNPVQLVITDILMPGRDGLETIGVLKEKYPAIKILAVSSGGTIQYMQYLRIAQLLGADAVMNKPLSVEFLLDTVDRLTCCEKSVSFSAI